MDKNVKDDGGVDQRRNGHIIFPSWNTEGSRAKRDMYAASGRVYYCKVRIGFIPAVIKLNDIVTYEQLGGSAARTLGSTDLRRATGTTTDLTIGPKTKQPL